MNSGNVNNSEFYNNFLGSSSANIVFAILVCIGAWIKTRLNRSKCAGNCYCFECESSLAQLEQIENKLTHTQTTQKEMLKEIVLHIREKKQDLQSILQLDNLKEHDG